MRCCVPQCKNDSRHISKSQGITFHVIPTESSLRTAWLKALGKDAWEPRERSAVCSDHFLREDLYVTKSGLRKVRSGAVPLILQDSNIVCDYGESASLKVCRICLDMDAKFVSISHSTLDVAYENLTGISVQEELSLPQKLCVTCAQKLINCRELRIKSLRAHALMVQVLKKHSQLTIQNIKSIDRDNNILSSSLSIKHYPVDYFDFQIDYDSTIDLDQAPIEIKQEDDIFLVEDPIKKICTDNYKKKSNDISENEAFDDVNGGFKYNSIDVDQAPIEMKQEDEEFIVQDPITKVTTDKINDNFVSKDVCLDVTDDFSGNDDLDRDFVLSDKDYSTDDNLPLEKCKSKVKKKNKVKQKPLKVKNKNKKVRKLKAQDAPPEPKVDRRRKPFLNDDLNETLFTITDLSFDEQIAEILKRKESSNYKNSVFKCTVCFKGFLDEDAYNSHVTRHTDQCGEHECLVCKTHFKHPHALRKHVTAHHTQRFSCKQCTYITTHRQTARLHERWHKGTKYKCPHCQDEFVKFTTYMGHIRIKHPSDFVCELCGYSFVSAKGIELHKKLKHRLDETQQIPDDGPLCEPCNVHFVSTDAYRRHLSVSARHNTGDKGREANKANKSRKPRVVRAQEARVETDGEDNDDPEKRRFYPSQIRRAEGPIPCEQCGLQLEDSRAYHGHFRRMHPDKNRTNYPSMKSPCMCEVCGRIFQSYALLKDHTWVHTGERPFKCELCDKAFRMKQRLVAHRRVHSAPRARYACDLCGKHFSTHSNRQRHMFIHTGLKPFKCEMCGKGFKHSSEKRAHITYVHLKKPWPKRARAKRRDTRQVQLPDQMAASDMDIAPPMWGACDPKLVDISGSVIHKPDYYNLKI